MRTINTESERNESENEFASNEESNADSTDEERSEEENLTSEQNTENQNVILNTNATPNSTSNGQRYAIHNKRDKINRHSDYDQDLKSGHGLEFGIDKQEGEMVIKRLDLKHSTAEEFIDKNNDIEYPLNQSDYDIRTESAIKSSFFLGGESDSPTEDEDESQPASDNYTDTNTYRKRNDFFQGGQKKDNSGRDNNRKRNLKEQHPPRNGFRGSGRRGNGQRMTEINSNKKFTPQSRSERRRDMPKNSSFNKEFGFKRQEEGIHPSWAAKRKIADSAHIDIYSKSKKITFDDDGVKHSSSLPSHTKTNTGSAFTRDGANTAAKVADLHPSWAAKKGQKGIQEFTGKKTKFTDDE